MTMGRLHLTGLVGVDKHRSNIGNSNYTGETGTTISKYVSQVIAMFGRKSLQSS